MSAPAEETAGLVDLADDHAGTDPTAALVELSPPEKGVDHRRLAGAVRTEEGAAWSGPPDLEVDGTEHDAPCRTTAPSSRATTAPLRGAAAIVKRRSHGIPRLVGPPRGGRSAFSDCRTFAACFSVRFSKNFRCALSGSFGFFFDRFTPVSAQDRCRRMRLSSSAFVVE